VSKRIAREGGQVSLWDLSPDLGIILDVAVSGRGGVAWLPDWLIEEALETGRLLRLLPDRPARLHDIHLLWPKATVVPARLQVAITALTGASELWPS
jgi:DNA-binding transcriptional LysR family regulator